MQASGKKTPEVIERIHELMAYDTAGDPISGLKWTRKTTAKIARELRSIDISISPNTVGRLLKTLGFRLRVNHKKRSHGSPHDRNEQFLYLFELRKHFEEKGLPVISVDSKKREMVGNFKNPGTAWRQEAVQVKDHDFLSEAEGKALLYGAYDVQANRGAIFVGVSHDTSEFAVESLARWWRDEGQQRYPHARELLILADGGGSNSPHRNAWKYELQIRLCDPYGLKVTVSHFPTGASKWNPIEHRLFSEISKNWAGEPLTSYETILNYIATTKTATGLEVKAWLDTKIYPKGVKISKEQMSQLILRRHEIQPKRNYTLVPH